MIRFIADHVRFFAALGMAIVLGYVAIQLLHIVSQPTQELSMQLTVDDWLASTPKPEVDPTLTAPVIVKPKPKPVRLIVAKPKPVKHVQHHQRKPKPKPIVHAKPAPPPPMNLLAHVEHRLVRSDYSQLKGLRKSEFLRGEYVFFSSLEDYTWKASLHTIKRAWTRLYLQQPLAFKRLHIQQASVKGRDFSGGLIRIEVQDEHGRWRILLDQHDVAIEQPLDIACPSDLSAIKGMRIKLKSPEPLYLGPIELFP